MLPPVYECFLMLVTIGLPLLFRWLPPATESSRAFLSRLQEKLIDQLKNAVPPGQHLFAADGFSITGGYNSDAQEVKKSPSEQTPMHECIWTGKAAVAMVTH